MSTAITYIRERAKYTNAVTERPVVQRAVERELPPALANPGKKRHRVKLPLIHGKEKRVLSLTNADIDEVLFG